jgi:hypothetical protein
VYHGKNVQLLPWPLPLQDARAHADCGCPPLPPLFDQAAAFSSPAISIEVTSYNTQTCSGVAVAGMINIMKSRLLVCIHCLYYHKDESFLWHLSTLEVNWLSEQSNTWSIMLSMSMLKLLPGMRGLYCRWLRRTIIDTSKRCATSTVSNLPAEEGQIQECESEPFFSSYIHTGEANVSVPLLKLQ